MDSEYLKVHLGKCLSDCLTEVSEKRPLDPIEYIAQWLYKHIDNVNIDKQEAGEKIQLKQEEEDFIKDQEKREKMKEEKQRFKEEQERKQKELEAQDTSGLPSLAEGEEPQETPRIQVEGIEEVPTEVVKEDGSTHEQEDQADAEETTAAEEDQEQQHTEENTDQQTAEETGEAEEQDAD